MDVLRTYLRADAVQAEFVFHYALVHVFHYLGAHLEALAVDGSVPGKGNVVLVHRQKKSRPAGNRIPHIIPGIGGAQQA